MAQITIRQQYRGRADKPADWEALVRIFDTIWGSDAHSLPCWPKVYGGVYASWRDASGANHKADSLDEVGEAYKQYETALIAFQGGLGEGPDCVFKYWPANAEALIEVKASDKETAERIITEVQQEFPFTARYVFVSYDSNELDLAVYIKDVLQKRLAPGITVFVAKLDIAAGADWLRVMLKEQLLRSEALIALCSHRSKTSPWLWWESSAVWARGGLVIPLFVNISPNEFNGPITLVCQGRSYFEVADIDSALREVNRRVCPGHPCQDLTPEEVVELERLQIMTSDKISQSTLSQT
ncbi:MAG: toll/interleukin-1 receptor domain-containing protein [Chloroflexi bacterium]|nr:toll/interleukin-1 receptor domain-containing protein [Chloroflexota bacterium]